jgi:isoleucyl-tRNA synthetase
MRKELDRAMDAEIRLEYDVADDRIADLVADHEALIAQEVRAGEVGDVSDGHRETWDVEDTEVVIAIERLVTAGPSA